MATLKSSIIDKNSLSTNSLEIKNSLSLFNGTFHTVSGDLSTDKATFYFLSGWTSGVSTTHLFQKSSNIYLFPTSYSVSMTIHGSNLTDTSNLTYDYPQLFVKNINSYDNNDKKLITGISTYAYDGQDLLGRDIYKTKSSITLYQDRNYNVSSEWKLYKLSFSAYNVSIFTSALTEVCSFADLYGQNPENGGIRFYKDTEMNTTVIEKQLNINNSTQYFTSETGVYDDYLWWEHNTNYKFSTKKYLKIYNDYVSSTSLYDSRTDGCIVIRENTGDFGIKGGIRIDHHVYSDSNWRMYVGTSATNTWGIPQISNGDLLLGSSDDAKAGFFGFAFTRGSSGYADYTDSIYNNPTISEYLVGYINPDANGSKLNFTGQHRVVAAADQDFLNKVGLIVVSNGNYSNIEHQENNINESLPIVEVSTKRQQKNVFGVISNVEDKNRRFRSYSIGCWVSVADKKNDEDNRLIVNSVGEGGIWVTNVNGNLENGDYITSSEIPGYGMRQDSEFLYNYTVAKITCDCDFNLESPIYICEEFQWEGQTYRRAFVGCTYHCG